MYCETCQLTILDHDWDRSMLDVAAAVLAHLDECPACRDTLRDYDALRCMLRLPESIPEPDEDKLRHRLDGVASIRPVRRRLHALAVALAGAILLAVGGWVLYFQARHLALHPALPPTQDIPCVAVPNSIRLTRADVDQGMKLFHAVSETFGGRAGWVAVTDDAADLGLMPESMVTNGRVFLLRIVLFEESKPLSSTDLIIRPGQAARMEVGLPSGRLLHYEVATADAPEPGVSIWAEVRQGGIASQALAALAATIRPVPGKTLDVGRMVTTAGTYNLELSFQQQELPQVAL